MDSPSLGGGAFAEVFHVEEKKTGQHYAIKVMHWPNFAMRGIEAQIDAEIRAMRLAAESGEEENYIVRMVNHAEEGEYVFVLLELCGQGDLLRLLMGQPLGQFSEDAAQRWTRQLLLGLRTLHYLGILHRDIKPDNLLCTEDGTLKIADFGWCAEVKDAPTALAGTFQYMAPEVLQNQPQTEAVDVWSTGATLYQLLTGRAFLNTYLGPGATNLSQRDPHEATRIKQSWLIQEIMDTCPPSAELKPESVSNLCWDFLGRLLEPDVQQRVTVEEALQHPWITPEGCSLPGWEDAQLDITQQVSPILSTAMSSEPSPEPLSPDPESNVPDICNGLSPGFLQCFWSNRDASAAGTSWPYTA
jgi:aurora kinase/aurora kinase A